MGSVIVHISNKPSTQSSFTIQCVRGFAKLTKMEFNNCNEILMISSKVNISSLDDIVTIVEFHRRCCIVDDIVA